LRRILVLVPLVAAAIALPATAAPAQVGTDGLPAPQVLLQFKFKLPKASTKLGELKVKGIPEGSKLVVRCLTADDEACAGKLGKTYTRENASGTVRVKRFERKIPAGNRLEATVTNANYKTIHKTLKIRANKNPTLTTTCSEPGSDERGAC